MIKIIVFLIFLIFIIVYQSVIYHNLVSFPKLWIWINKNNNKKIVEKQRKDIYFLGSTEGYFDSINQPGI
jgi:hypothetical protein